MAITVSSGSQNRPGVFQNTESLTGATTSQAISVITHVSELAASTATQGNFSLAGGIEGQEKVIMMTGTGVLNSITPTDFGLGYTSLLLSATDQFAVLRYINSAWHLVQHNLVASTATTATGVAVALYAAVT